MTLPFPVSHSHLADLRLRWKAVDSPEVPLLPSKFHMHEELVFNEQKLQDVMADHQGRVRLDKREDSYWEEL